MYVMHGKHFQTLSDLVDEITLDFETEEVDYALDATDNLSQLPPTTEEFTNVLLTHETEERNEM